MNNDYISMSENEKIAAGFLGRFPYYELAWLNDPASPKYAMFKEIITDRLTGLYRTGHRRFLTRVLPGSDFVVLDCLLEKQAKHADIEIECVVAAENETEKWPEKERSAFEYYISKAAKVTYLAKTFDVAAVRDRDRYIIDESDELTALHSGDELGSNWEAIEYADKLKKVLILFRYSSSGLFELCEPLYFGDFGT